MQLLEEKRTVEEHIAAQERRLRELDDNIEGHRRTEEEIQNRLRTLHEARELQERRDGLLKDKDARETSLRDVNTEMSALISGRAYTIFLPDVCKTYHEVMSGMRQRGELPAGIKRQFVEDLLARKQCICGRSLGHDIAPDARAIVEGWKDRAGLADVEEKAIRMGAEVKHLEDHTAQFWAQLDQSQTRRRADREELSRIETQLDEISLQLRNSGQEELGQLEGRFQQTKSAIERDLVERGACAGNIRQKEKALEEIETALAKHRATETRQQLVQRRIVAAREVVERITESKRRFELRFRTDLSKKVRTLFDSISFTPYVPEIGDDYSLRLRESAGGMPLPVAASQGESQILSLCFIGGVISLVREYQARTERLPGPDSSKFPLVMDSPFGSLGPTYRRQVADHITVLADQVIIMVTNTQWRGEVEQSLRGRVGRSYVLQYFSPKQDVISESIDVAGRVHELVSPSPCEYEYTTVLEVPSA